MQFEPGVVRDGQIGDRWQAADGTESFVPLADVDEDSDGGV